MVGQPVGRYSWRGRFRSVLRWPAGASVGRCRQLREDDGPRRRIRKGRVVVGAGGSCGKLLDVRFRASLATGYILPDQRGATFGNRSIGLVEPLHQRQRFQLPFQMPLQVCGHQPLTWLRADCNAASAASQSPSYSADIRSTTPSGGVVEPAGRQCAQTLPRSRCETPDADQAWRSGRTRSTLVPSRRCPWRAADRRPTTGPEAAVHRPPPAARPP